MGVKLGNGKWAIKEDKLLAYNDNSGRFFNKEFDFSRGSSATYVAKDGLIKTAGLQETNLVNNGDFSELGSELVTNGNFDTDSDWTKGTGWSISDGKAVAVLASNTFLLQNQNTVANKIYKVVYTVSNYQNGEVRFQFNDGGGNSKGANVSANGTYTEYITSVYNHTTYRFKGTSSDGGFTGSIDNVSVKQVDPNDYWSLNNANISNDKLNANTSITFASFATQNLTFSSNKNYKITFEISNYTSGTVNFRMGASGVNNIISVTSNGTFTKHFNGVNETTFQIRSGDGTTIASIDNVSVQEVQTDTPRIDFTNDTKGHLLLEPQSTNLITYSEDFSQSVWAKNGLTLTSNDLISPEGILNASKLQATQVSGVHLISVSASSSNVKTYSVFAKQNGYKRFRFNTGSSGNGFTSFNLNTGSVVSTGGTFFSSSNIEDYGNGWYKCSMTLLANAPNNYTLAIEDDDGQVNFLADGISGIYIWGAQVEEKSFSTSYIPNHGVSGGVTRLADVCNNSGSAQDFSESGVLYAEIAAFVSEANNEYISISDGTNDERVVLGYVSNNNIRVFVKSGGSFYATTDINLSNALDYNKIAFKYKSGNNIIYLNGNKVNTDTDTYSLGAFNVLNFSTGNALSNYFYGKVREVQVFTEALTDEQLQKLTTI